MWTKNWLKVLMLAMMAGIALAGLGCSNSDDDDDDDDGPASTKSSATALTENVWANGNIVNSDGGGSGEQWFKFVATASTQRVYVKLGTISYVYVYLYDDDDNQIGGSLRVNGNSGKVSYNEWSLNSGETYYVKVTGRWISAYGIYCDYGGTYWIGFTDFPAQPETVITELSEGAWMDGNIIGSNKNGADEQWFKFKATASTQYVYVKLSTLTGLGVYLYDNKNSVFYQIGDSNWVSGSSGKVGYSEWSSLTSGTTYYIQVKRRSDAYTGTYWIAFTSTESEPQ